MTKHQLDLFADMHAGADLPPPEAPPRRAAADMDDAALIAALPEPSLAESLDLTAEAGRRQLVAAVPALETLCRRFAGFGASRAVPEQVAALRALAMIGGHDAAQAVSRIIDRAVVQGPNLAVALGAAAQLGAILSDDVSRVLLQHAEAAIRADACRCVRRALDFVPALARLLDDVDRAVVRSAACTLGQMGRPEARLTLKNLLRDDPSSDVIDAVSSVADEDCVVLLGRIARSIPSLADAALDALDNADHPRAAAVAAAIRNRPRP